MTTPIFNKQLFLQSLGGDVELAQELLAAFLEDSPERSSSLKAALETGNAEEASRMAHSLKGMCGVVRAEDLVSLALSMENASKNGDLEKTRDLYATFSTMLIDAHKEMENFEK